jgi:hypothetical protein
LEWVNYGVFVSGLIRHGPFRFADIGSVRFE